MQDSQRKNGTGNSGLNINSTQIVPSMAPNKKNALLTRIIDYLVVIQNLGEIMPYIYPEPILNYDAVDSCDTNNQGARASINQKACIRTSSGETGPAFCKAKLLSRN